MTAKSRQMTNAWTDGEIAILREGWKTTKPVKDWAHLLPARSIGAIKARAFEIGLGPRSVSRAGRSIAWALVQQLLADGVPRSTKEMAGLIQISRRSLDHCMRQMHGKGLRVGDYGEQGLDGVRPRLWTLGSQPDAKRPKTESRKARNHRRWKELKKDPERLGVHYAKMKLRNAERAGRLVRPADAAAWLNSTPVHEGPALRTADFRTEQSPASAPAFPRAAPGFLAGATQQHATP